MQALSDQIGLIWVNLPVLLEGAGQTVCLTLAMLAVGVAVSIPLALLQLYGPAALRVALVEPIILFFRGVPSLVLLFIFYFGAAHVDIRLSGFAAAVIAIGLRSGIYQSQIVRGAIQAVAAGQMLAARSIGMSRGQAIRSIILPQALRIALPPWTNEYAVVLKESSLAYALGVTELMRQGRYIVARTFGNSLAVYITCAVIYFILVYAGGRLIRMVERRFSVPGFETTADRRGTVEREERL